MTDAPLAAIAVAASLVVLPSAIVVRMFATKALLANRRVWLLSFTAAIVISVAIISQKPLAIDGEFEIWPSVLLLLPSILASQMIRISENGSPTREQD